MALSHCRSLRVEVAAVLLKAYANPQTANLSFDVDILIVLFLNLKYPFNLTAPKSRGKMSQRPTGCHATAKKCLDYLRSPPLPLLLQQKPRQFNSPKPTVKPPFTFSLCYFFICTHAPPTTSNCLCLTRSPFDCFSPLLSRSINRITVDTEIIDSGKSGFVKFLAPW